MYEKKQVRPYEMHDLEVDLRWAIFRPGFWPICFVSSETDAQMVVEAMNGQR